MSDATSDTRPNIMEIDLGALDANLARIKGLLAPGTKIIASVKGNAYGLGLSEIASRLADGGVHSLTTGSFTDAMTIRKAGINTEIMMFGGALPSGMATYVAHNLVPTVHNMELAEAVSAAARKPTKVYLKIDSGWGRLGVPLKKAKQFALDVARLPNVLVEGIYTPLPFFDAAGMAFAQQRTEAFDALVADIKRAGLEIPIQQARSSAGILAGIKDACNAASPGGILYGKSPLPDDIVETSAFRPVTKAVRSRLIHVAPDAADRTPGFASRYAERVTGATGVLPFGRADGNRAPLPGREAYMLVAGKRAPVLGVSSEHAVIDLSGIPGARVGDEVVVLGRSDDEEITLKDLAAWQGTTGSDILLMLSNRLQRTHVG